MLKQLKSPWLIKKTSKEDIEKQTALLAAMKKKAQEILDDQKFIEYRKMYQSYHAREIENIMMLNEEDPLKYAFKIRQIVDTLKAYRLLISSVEEDSQRQIEEVS